MRNTPLTSPPTAMKSLASIGRQNELNLAPSFSFLNPLRSTCFVLYIFFPHVKSRPEPPS